MRGRRLPFDVAQSWRANPHAFPAGSPVSTRMREEFCQKPLNLVFDFIGMPVAIS